MEINATDITTLWIKSLVATVLKPPIIVYTTITTANTNTPVIYGIPNKEWNSLPQAAKPDAVYGIKNITMTSAASAVMIFFLSRKRLAKNDGTVIASTL